MKETFYFSHDYGARNDEKILKLVQKEGWEGYGIYWAIIEKLYEADGFIEEDYDCIAFDLRTECDRINRIINDYKLFTVASKKIHSKSCLARLATRKGISEQNRQNAILRWNKRKKIDATALQSQSEGNASKVKESKVNESKINTLQPAVADNTNKLFDILYKINPTIKYANVSQRKATQRLYSKLGEEKVLKMAEYAVSVFGVKYAPSITTPIELENNLSKLASYWQKNNSSNVVSI